MKETRAPPRLPMKVLIVDTAVAFGGTLVVARNLLNHFDPSVVDATLVSACSDGFVSPTFAGAAKVRLLAPRVDYVRLARWKGALRNKLRWRPLHRLVEMVIIVGGILANLPYVLRLANLCRREGVQVVHVNNYSAEPLWAARLMRIPIVFHMHGFLGPRLERITRDNFRHVAAFVSISKAVADAAVIAGIGRENIHDIPNFVACLPPATPPPMPAVPAIGIFGRVIGWKGQKEFLRAALQVLPLHPELRVMIVGGSSDGDPDYLRECQEMANTSGFGGRIEFTGPVLDVKPYYERCTIVAHASIEPEPFGMVLVEAMAAARPVVASQYGAPPEIIEDGVEGYLVDPSDSEAMAARICELLATPELAIGMGLRGHARVRAFYDPARGARQFQSLYQDVIRGTATRSSAS